MLKCIFPLKKIILIGRDQNDKKLLLVVFRLEHRGMDKAKNEVFVGPTSFRRFMECFRYLYTVKSKERTDTVDQLK